MKFTDLFINKPVLAIVVSLLILVLGLRAVTSLTVRQYPKTENATVTVTTAYYGADAQTIAGFITQPLEQAISQAQGIDYLSSSSVVGRVDHHRDAAPQLRRQPRADRDHHPGQLGEEPAAAAGAAAGVERADRRDHRRDVPRLLQRRAADQQHHRLPGARGQAQARCARGRADRRAARRTPVRAARVAGPGARWRRTA